MTLGSQATGVLDLGEGLAAVGLRRPLGHLRQRLPLHPQCVAKARRVMAVHAGHEVVLGGRPCLVIWLHDVALVAEQRRGADVVGRPQEEQGDDDGEGPEYLEEPGPDVQAVLAAGRRHVQPPEGHEPLPTGLQAKIRVLAQEAPPEPSGPSGLTRLRRLGHSFLPSSPCRCLLTHTIPGGRTASLPRAPTGKIRRTAPFGSGFRRPAGGRPCRRRDPRPGPCACSPNGRCRTPRRNPHAAGAGAF